jgi:hypothetical protein
MSKYVRVVFSIKMRIDANVISIGEMFPLSKREFEQVKMQFDEDELFNE